MANGRTGVIDQWGGKLSFFFSYTHFSHDLTTGLLAALLPFIVHDLKLDYLQAGFLVSAFSLTAGFSQLLGGWLSDRIPRKNAVALGLAGVGTSAVAVSLAGSYYAMLGVLIAMGVFAGFYHPSAVSTLTGNFEERRRGRVIALHNVGGSLGFGIGPLFGAIIASSLNWHLAFVFLGIPAIIAAVLVFSQLKLPSAAVMAKDAPSAAAAGRSSVAVWQVFRSALGIIAISVAMQLVTGPVMSFMSLFLVNVRHLSDADASMWVTVIRMGGLAGGLVGGWLTDRWGRRKTILLTLVIFGPVVYGLARLPFGVALACALVLFGWLMTMREATMQTLLMDASPARLRATVFGIYFGFGQQGSSVIQPIAGDLMDSVGIVGIYNSIAFISIGLSCLAGILVFRRSKRAEVGYNASQRQT